MKKIILALAMLTGLHTLAADAEYGASWKNIDNETFHSHFSVKGDIFVLDPTGTKFLASTTETRTWHPGKKSDKVDADWSVAEKSVNEIAIHLVWEINKDNSISYTIQQYDKLTRDLKSAKRSVTYGKLIREETKTLENFAPVTWVAETSKDHRVILRFTPEVDPIHEVDSLEKIPIGGDRGSFIVTDNQGYLWGEDVRFGGILAGMTSHRGSFIISLYPFEGCKQLGFASGKTMTLNMTDELQVKIRSDADLIPGERRVKVYGKYIPDFKSSSSNHAASYGQEKLSGFPKEFFR